ncbi:hypothetical protein FI667_g5305, partial [Globisporangium splendens]
MAKLLCAMASAKGSAIAIQVDERDSVADVKNAIANEIKCSVHELQLYLAKKKDGTWLLGKDADSSSVISDYQHLKWTAVTLCEIGLSDEEVGGYDAVFINKREQLVRFVHVTRSETHSFDAKHTLDSARPR